MDKRDLILNCVNLGMEARRAYYAAELTQDEMDEMDKDEQFQRKIKAKEAILEKTLLEKLNVVINRNVEKGNSKELRYKLGAISPRWRAQTGAGAIGSGGQINIFVKDYDVDQEETAEVYKGD